MLKLRVHFWGSGHLLALELRRANCVRHLVDVCGPNDPAEARISQPASLRALYGSDARRNGMHCSASEQAPCQAASLPACLASSQGLRSVT